MYSSLEDLESRTNRWNSCGFDENNGFPGRCGVSSTSIYYQSSVFEDTCTSSVPQWWHSSYTKEVFWLLYDPDNLPYDALEYNLEWLPGNIASNGLPHFISTNDTAFSWENIVITGAGDDNAFAITTERAGTFQNISIIESVGRGFAINGYGVFNISNLAVSELPIGKQNVDISGYSEVNMIGLNISTSGNALQISEWSRVSIIDSEIQTKGYQYSRALYVTSAVSVKIDKLNFIASSYLRYDPLYVYSPSYMESLSITNSYFDCRNCRYNSFGKYEFVN